MGVHWIGIEQLMKFKVTLFESSIHPHFQIAKLTLINVLALHLTNYVHLLCTLVCLAIIYCSIT